MSHKTATVLFVDRGTSARSLKKHRVDHSVLFGSGEVWARIVAAADAASGSAEMAQRVLWTCVDKQVVDKSVAVKATIQALCLRKLEFRSANLALWMRRARVVAAGLHALYAEAMVGWNRGLDARSAAVDAGAAVPLEAWSPFELYDRTDHPRFAGCFGESAVQRMRSRVRVGAGARSDWEAAVDAHWQMLTLEAEDDVFATSSTLSAAEVGGLFLLSHTADNWPKRCEVFDEDFWLLRVVHLGLERNTSLQIAKFDLSTLQCGQPLSSGADSRKVYCWLVNALVSLVALKVAIFYKIRLHAYDAVAGRPLTSEAAFAALVKVDRHDLEQSKSHWRPLLLPSPSTTATTAPSSPSACSACSASPVSKRARRADADASPRPLLDTERLVPVRDVLERLAVERRALRARIDALDTAVGTHLAFYRLVKAHMDALHRTALSRLDALTHHLATTAAPGARAELEAEMQRLSCDFTLAKIQKAAMEAARTEVATIGLELRVEDRVLRSEHPSARILLAVGWDTTARIVRRQLRQPGEFDRLFGPDGTRGELGMGTAPVARCANDGVLRVEACSLVDRLLGLARSESELREVVSLDTLVRLPLELTPPLALAGKLADDLPTRVPAHVKQYTAALKADETHTKASHFCASARRAMANAMQKAVEACVDAMAFKGDGEMPFRIKQQERRAQCATAVLGTMLSVAHAFGGLAVDDDDGEVHGVVPILVWHCETRRWRVPFAERVVEDHWEATKHLLWIVSITEPWLKDPRKPCAFALEEHQTWVRPGLRGPLVRAEQQAHFLRWLDERTARLAPAWWPNWPPKSSQITTLERIKTALAWGNGMHACAFLSLDAETAKSYRTKAPWN